MNRLILIYCIGLTLLSSSLYSQKHREFKLLPIGSPNETNNPSIASITISSRLTDSVFIGIVPSEVPNTRDILDAPNGIQNCFQTYVNKVYGPTFSSTGAKLIWAIDALSAGVDSSNDSKFSYVKIGVEILKPGSDQNYQKLARYDTLIVSTNSDIALGSQMATAINSLYTNSVKLASPPSLDNMKLTSSSIKVAKIGVLVDESGVNDNPTTSWRILKDTTYINGVYMSFEEFKNNKPSIDRFTTEVDTTNDYIHILEFHPDSSTTELSDVWGIAVNNELYRYKDGGLYPIEKKGEGFVLSKYLDFSTRKNQALFWRRRIGPRLTDNNPYNDRHIYRIPIFNGSPLKVESTKINSVSGDFSF